MKLWYDYIKEMKIAARGFYFFIEIFFSVIVLIILLVAVKEEPVSKEKEFLYYDMSDELYEYVTKDEFEEGQLVLAEPTEFKVKPIGEVTVESLDTGEKITYNFDDETTIVAETIEMYDDEGKFDKTLYKMDTLEDTVRMAYTEKNIGGVIKIDENFNASYIYYTQGYETERYTNVLYVVHNDDLDVLIQKADEQEIRTLGVVERLNNRENFVPLYLAFSGAVMCMFIIMAYIFLDKDEGVIKAISVTPVDINNYLFSKIGVVLTMNLVSTLIVTIPIMGAKPNYLLLLLFMTTATVAMGAVGLFIGSFFDSMTKAFGVLYAMMIILMLPGFSYYIPSFDPTWLKFFPSYSMLHGFKEIMMENTDVGYVLMYSGIYIVGAAIFFILAKIRYKSTLTV